MSQAVCMSSYCGIVEMNKVSFCWLWNVYDVSVSSCWCGNKFAVRHFSV